METRPGRRRWSAIGSSTEGPHDNVVVSKPLIERTGRLSHQTSERMSGTTFIGLSESSKLKAQQSLQRRSNHTQRKTERRNSIMNSLDKYLQDDDNTDTTFNQSSFSSGLSSETQRSKTQNPPLSRLEPNIVEEVDETSMTTPNKLENESQPRQRYRRRGSVTRYSLGDNHSSNVLDDSYHQDESVSVHSVSTTDLGLQDERHHPKSAVDSLLSPSTSSQATLDDRPIPMRGQKSHHRRMSIDERPLPMKAATKGVKSKQSSLNSQSAHPNLGSSGIPKPPLVMNRSSSLRSTTSNHSNDSSLDDSFAYQSAIEEERYTGNATIASTTSGRNSANKPQKPKRTSLAGLDRLPKATEEDVSVHTTRISNSCHRSTSSTFVSDDGSAASSTAGSESSPRKRLQRRGSITAFSLGGSNHDRRQDTLNQHFTKCSEPKVNHVEDDHRSYVSDGILLPPRPKRSQRKSESSVGTKGSTKSLSAGLAFVAQNSRSDDHLQDDSSVVSGTLTEGGGSRRYRRRGSVTKYSFEPEQKEGGDLHDDNRSCASEGALTRPPRPGPRPSSRRSSTKSSSNISLSSHEKSATRISLVSKDPQSPTSPTAWKDPKMNGGKSYGTARTSISMPSMDDCDISQDCAPSRQRYRRRGSVTKYSLDT